MSFTASTTSPAPAGRPRAPRLIGVIVLGVVLLAAGLGIGRLTAPTGDGHTPTAQTPTASSPANAPATGFDAPHGPTTITQGVPSGFTRDKAGARTAAMIAVQLQPAVARGYADPETVKTTWLAGNADAATRQVFSQGRSATVDQTIKALGDIDVKDFTENDAVVEVWVSSVGTAAGINGRGAIRSQAWSTVTYHLKWENDDWKVVTFTTTAGPQLGTDSTSASPQHEPFAFYTFFIE